MKRWRVVAFDVNGNETSEIGRAYTRWGAERIEARYRRTGRQMFGRGAPTGILEPIPGRPLYSIAIQRVA